MDTGDDDTTTFTHGEIGGSAVLDLLDEQPPDFPSPSVQEDDGASLRDPKSDLTEQDDEDDVTIFRSAPKLNKITSSNVDKTHVAPTTARRSPRKKASLPGIGMPTEQPVLATPLNSRNQEAPHEQTQTEDDEPQPTRESQLLAERDRLQSMNSYLEETIQSMQVALEKAKGLSTTVDTTHALMDTYTKILSQMTHTSELLLDKDWEQSKDDELIAQNIAKEKEEQERKFREEQEAAAAAARAAQQTLLQMESKEKSPPSTGRGLSRGLRGRSRIAQSRGSSSSTIGGRGRVNSSAIPTPSSQPSSVSAQKGTRGSGTVTGVRAQRGLRSRVITRKPRGAS